MEGKGKGEEERVCVAFPESNVALRQRQGFTEGPSTRESLDKEEEEEEEKDRN